MLQFLWFHNACVCYSLYGFTLCVFVTVSMVSQCVCLLQFIWFHSVCLLQFLRLQGKKQRGKEEITLIDVNADDYTDPSEITKHLTEEETYQSHRKKDNQPSGQQKRKHQIHYLAFQVSLCAFRYVCGQYVPQYCIVVVDEKGTLYFKNHV